MRSDDYIQGLLSDDPQQDTTRSEHDFEILVTDNGLKMPFSQVWWGFIQEIKTVHE